MSATHAGSFLSPLLGRERASSFQLENERNRVSVARHLLTAFDSPSRRKGLLGRSTLAPGTALIIAPCSAIHTWRMQFDIDVAFVAKDAS
jgi:hypothetical protein